MYSGLLFSSLANYRHESPVDLLLRTPISVLLHIFELAENSMICEVLLFAASIDTICRAQGSPHPSPSCPPQQGAGQREQAVPLVPSRMRAAGRVLWRSKSYRASSHLCRCGKSRMPLSLDVHVLTQQSILTW